MSGKTLDRLVGVKRESHEKLREQNPFAAESQLDEIATLMAVATILDERWNLTVSGVRSQPDIDAAARNALLVLDRMHRMDDVPEAYKASVRQAINDLSAALEPKP